MDANESAYKETPLSPCIGVCRLQGNECVGCHRTLQEIEVWESLSNDDRKVIMDRLSHKQ